MLQLQRNLDIPKNQLVYHQIQKNKLKWNIHAVAAMSRIPLPPNYNGFNATLARNGDIENVTKDYKATSCGKSLQLLMIHTPVQTVDKVCLLYWRFPLRSILLTLSSLLSMWGRTGGMDPLPRGWTPLPPPNLFFPTPLFSLFYFIFRVPTPIIVFWDPPPAHMTPTPAHFWSRAPLPLPPPNPRGPVPPPLCSPTLIG